MNATLFSAKDGGRFLHYDSAADFSLIIEESNYRCSIDSFSSLAVLATVTSSSPS